LRKRGKARQVDGAVFHVSDGAAKKSAQAWLIRGGLVDLRVSNVTKFREFEIIA
jgi:hypothetical protein